MERERGREMLLWLWLLWKEWVREERIAAVRRLVDDDDDLVGEEWVGSPAADGGEGG